MIFFKKKKNYFLFFFLFFLVIFLINYFLNNQISNFLRSKNISFLALIQEEISPIFLFFSDSENFNLEEKQKTITDLKRENFILKNRINYLLGLEKENLELKKVLSIKTNTAADYILARVIAYEPQNNFLSLVINKGKKDKVKNDAVVISFDKDKRFLIGFVRYTFEETSIVQTLLDKNTQVAIKIVRENKELPENPDQVVSPKGILQGRGYFSRQLVVDLVDINEADLVNQEIFTSGLGDKYPENILIGKSVGVEKKHYGLFQKLIVAPYVNFFKMDYVFIITSS